MGRDSSSPCARGCAPTKHEEFVLNWCVLTRRERALRSIYARGNSNTTAKLAFIRTNKPHAQYARGFGQIGINAHTPMRMQKSARMCIRNQNDAQASAHRTRT